MEGGLFGLSYSQLIYLGFIQFLPAIAVLYTNDLFILFVIIEILYVTLPFAYIFVGSLERTLKPYFFNQLNKLKYQIDKGSTLGLSAFLLITIYGILILKIGKVVLPARIQLGYYATHYWYLLILLVIINPLLEQWFWRLFLPKTFESSYYKSHLINITYLLFHFALFARFIGVWRAIPFVGTFFSIGRSMSHIKDKYGIIASVLTHYGITLAGLVLYAYIDHYYHAIGKS